MKKFFLRLLQILMLLILFSVLYAWTNIWIPKNSFGILHTSKESIIIPSTRTIKTIFPLNWYWQRLIPGKTTLIVLPSTPITTGFKGLYSLPISSTPSSSHNTLLEFYTTITYTINTENIVAYLTQLYSTNEKQDTDSILNFIEVFIEKQFFTLPNPISIHTSPNKIALANTISNTLSNALTSLPVTTQITTEILTMPDIAYYQSREKKEEALQIQNMQLNQYLLFIEALGTKLNTNPLLTDLIKVLPPEKIFPFTEE